MPLEVAISPEPGAAKPPSAGKSSAEKALCVEGLPCVDKVLLLLLLLLELMAPLCPPPLLNENEFEVVVPA